MGRERRGARFVRPVETPARRDGRVVAEVVIHQRGPRRDSAHARSAEQTHDLVVGESAVSEGDPADGAYVVLTGRCVVLEGDEAVATLTPGELFGEIGALDRGVRSATVVAVDPCELLFLSVEQLRDGFVASPGLLWDSLRLIVHRLGMIAARQVAYRDEHISLREVQRSLLPDLSAECLSRMTEGRPILSVKVGVKADGTFHYKIS